MLMVTGEIKVIVMVSENHIGIRVTKAIAKCVLYIIVTALLSINNNNYDYTERERKVIELYNQGKSTREIAQILRIDLLRN